MGAAAASPAIGKVGKNNHLGFKAFQSSERPAQLIVSSLARGFPGLGDDSVGEIKKDHSPGKGSGRRHAALSRMRLAAWTAR